MKPNSQKTRLIAVITGDKYWTLEEIALATRAEFQKIDTPAALSARWRDVKDSKHFKKHKRLRGNSRYLYEYRIEILKEELAA